jgi:hypothetical protein
MRLAGKEGIAGTVGKRDCCPVVVPWIPEFSALLPGSDNPKNRGRRVAAACDIVGLLHWGAAG